MVNQYRIWGHIMKKLIILFLIYLFITCSGENKKDFNLEVFEDAMKDKGYNFEIQDANQDFLPTTRKRMLMDDIVIDIYIFKSNKEMEREASNIGIGGSYNNGRKAINVSWVSVPHFYKKGRLIIQYIGENESIISDLTEILGEQFAGHISS